MKYKNVPIHDIVIYKHPLLYLSLTFGAILDLLIWIKDQCMRRFQGIILLVVIVLSINFIEFLSVNKSLYSAITLPVASYFLSTPSTLSEMQGKNQKFPI